MQAQAYEAPSTPLQVSVASKFQIWKSLGVSDFLENECTIQDCNLPLRCSLDWWLNSCEAEIGVKLKWKTVELTVCVMMEAFASSFPYYFPHVGLSVCLGVAFGSHHNT